MTLEALCAGRSVCVIIPPFVRLSGLRASGDGGASDVVVSGSSCRVGPSNLTEVRLNWGRPCSSSEQKGLISFHTVLLTFPFLNVFFSSTQYQRDIEKDK